MIKNVWVVEQPTLFVCLMVFNTTFNNISAISWRSVLLVEETGGPRETTDLSQVTDKLYHIMLYTSPWSRFKLTTSVVIGTDCIGSCKSNYHTITTTTAPQSNLPWSLANMTLTNFSLASGISLVCTKLDIYVFIKAW